MRYYIGTFRMKDDESSDIWHDTIMLEQLGDVLSDAFLYGGELMEERSVPKDFDVMHCHVYATFKDERKAILFQLKYPQVRPSEKIQREEYAKDLNWVG